MILSTVKLRFQKKRVERSLEARKRTAYEYTIVKELTEAWRSPSPNVQPGAFNSQRQGLKTPRGHPGGALIFG